METENSTGPAQDDPTQSAEAASKDLQRILFWAGYVCGAMAFIFWPILFGPAGIIVGVVNLRRGEKKHGQQQIGLGVLGLVVGFLISLAINGAFEGNCSRDNMGSRMLELNANIASLPPMQMANAQRVFAVGMSRMQAALYRGDESTACKIVDDLERQLK